MLLEPIRRRLPDHCWPQIGNGVKVVAAELRNDAGILGAAAQALERLRGLMSFSVQHRDPGSRARTGSLALDHGTVSTPCFMPVGTNATVKAMRNRRPGGDRGQPDPGQHLPPVPAAGPGGDRRRRRAAQLHGVAAQHPHRLRRLPGLLPVLVPQGRGRGGDLPFPHRRLRAPAHPGGRRSTSRRPSGSDVMMPLDECTAPGISRAEAETRRAADHRVARRGAATRWREQHGRRSTGKLFGIMQGNFYQDLRQAERGADRRARPPGLRHRRAFRGGGVSDVPGVPPFLARTLLPGTSRSTSWASAPRSTSWRRWRRGSTCSTASFPPAPPETRRSSPSTGRCPCATRSIRLDFRPIDGSACARPAAHHTRAYLRHLFKAREIQAAVLATMPQPRLHPGPGPRDPRVHHAGRVSRVQEGFPSRYEGGEG